MEHYAYRAKFRAGSEVRVATRGFLDEFLREWKYHHPLSTEQLKYADAIAAVKSVGFYHGADARPFPILKAVPVANEESCDLC
jgi:hypothetical protein